MSAASPASPNKYYRAARWFGAAFVVSMLLVPLSLTLLTSTPPVPNSDNTSLALILSLGAFMVSGLGTASTVVLGWRSERRETAESRLRIEHLELQLAMARENVPQAEDPD